MKKLGVFTIIGFVADILTCSQTLSNCLVSFGFTEETAKLINGYMLLASIVLTGILLGSWLVMYWKNRGRFFDLKVQSVALQS